MVQMFALRHCLQCLKFIYRPMRGKNLGMICLGPRIPRIDAASDEQFMHILRVLQN